jgi:hypothetical protein
VREKYCSLAEKVRLNNISVFYYPCSHLSFSLFVSLVYCAESTVRWFVVREKHCWMAADSADKSKRTGRLSVITRLKLPTPTLTTTSKY